VKYLSVCSGIEAATVAWHRLGWCPVGFAEIEEFPSAVLAHHYPDVPNYGDFTKIGAPAIDLLVGGTPCQSFSIAGLRGGLADDRGNLALEFFRLAQRTRARWVVWENVPGVLSSNGGRDFGSILGAMVELGYGFAYRVLDAQFFGVPQRRRRVFVVGCLGNWAAAASVLFERESLRRNHRTGGRDGEDHPDESPGGADGGAEVAPPYAFKASHFTRGKDGAPAKVWPPLSADADRGDQDPLLYTDEIAQTLNARDFKGPGSYMNGSVQSCQIVRGRVRRLTPREGERLQGFPTDYTLLRGQTRKKIEADYFAYFANAYPDMPAEEIYRLAKDTPRYKAIGNSMAVPCMGWLGRRIQKADEAIRRADAA
jgi:DNA (cytosine-5)-methyltransferase 1